MNKSKVNWDISSHIQGYNLNAGTCSVALNVSVRDNYVPCVRVYVDIECGLARVHSEGQVLPLCQALFPLSNNNLRRIYLFFSKTEVATAEVST